MKSGSKKKKFDAVKMMREIREGLSKIYDEHPEIEERELKKIRRKYGFRRKNLQK
ncbi:MAG: hypothetical protein ACE5GL_05030 [Calditrichia bacterium]